MGYFYLTNNRFDLSTASNTNMVWVGESSVQKAFEMVSLIKQYPSVNHYFILFNRIESIIENNSFAGKTVILSEEYPLWDDDYTIVNLIEAFNSFDLEFFLPVDSPNIIVGNPAELFFQAFVKTFFLKNHQTTNTSFSQLINQKDMISFMLLKDDIIFSDIQKEVEELNQLIEDRFSVKTQIPSQESEWLNYFDMIDKTHSVEANSFKSLFIHLFNENTPR